LQEGVGSSQIIPLLRRLSSSGLRIELISFEKLIPGFELTSKIEDFGVVWKPLRFGSKGVLGGIRRVFRLKHAIGPTKLIHARSDLPAVAAILSNRAPVIWDVRSLWADQKILIQPTIRNRFLYRYYKNLEKFACARSTGMSTLTTAVVPILEKRNGVLPKFRTVVPTAVDLETFQFISGLPDSVTALFSGTYNDYYDLDLSREFLLQLRRKIAMTIHWARPFESDRGALDVGEEKIIVSSQSEMAKLIPNYSFGVAICRSEVGPSLTAAMPTKIAEFLACGRPIIVNEGLGDMDSLLQELKIGVSLSNDYSKIEGKVQEFVEILMDPQTPVRCREIAERHFDIAHGAIKYIDLYSNILSSK
jgi:glycosyltransferase involved in cell wall biosynthesis